MKRTLVVVLLLGLSAQARADTDNRETWRAAFAGSVTLTLGGVMFYWHGSNKVADAEDELCERGAYPQDPGCPEVMGGITAAELDRINAKGDRGATIAQVGAGITLVGLVLTGVTFYKGFIAKPHKESTVAVTPTVSSDGAGATLFVRW